MKKRVDLTGVILIVAGAACNNYYSNNPTEPRLSKVLALYKNLLHV